MLTIEILYHENKSFQLNIVFTITVKKMYFKLTDYIIKF